MIVKDTGKDRALGEDTLSRRTRLFVIRHGQVVGHEAFCFHGFTDIPLTPYGIEQMENLARYLRDVPLDAIYCSDLTRCRVGAEILARDRDLEVGVLPGLREMNLGDLEGMTYREAMDRYADFFRAWRDDVVHSRVPGGECLMETADRVLPALDTILSDSQGKTLLLVAHGGSNRIILSRAMNLDLKYVFRIEQDYGCVNVIDYFPDWAVVKLINGHYTHIQELPEGDSEG